jgi:hypothetical protein
MLRPMTLRGRFAYHLAVRVAATSAAAHLRRRGQARDSGGHVDGVMMSLWALSMVALAAGGATVAWWLVTGRGPGGKVVSAEQWWLPGNPNELLRSWR